jgi:hypothetical protein
MARIAHLLVFTTVAISAVALQSCARMDPKQAGTQAAILPAPVDDIPGERGQDFKQMRREWMQRMHRAEPGVDPLQLDAAYRQQRMMEMQQARATLHEAGADADDFLKVDTRAVSGVWRERGSVNQAGRTTGYIHDAATGEGIVLSHGGNLWMGSPAAWTSLNDSATFPGAQHIERFVTTGVDRLIVASASPTTGVFYSDDLGASFQSATGLSTINIWYVRDLAIRDAAGTDAYLLRVEWDGNEWSTRLFASTNRGSSFSDRGFVGPRGHVGLFSPRYGSSEVYLLQGTNLSRIQSGTHALVPVGSVPIPALGANDTLSLSGGVTNGGETFLFAFHQRSATDDTQVYRSLDGGANWFARGVIPTRLFSTDSAESSTRDPEIAFAGGVNAFRSLNGGNSWTLINDWAEYYGAPATKLHADIPDIDVWRDGGGNERVYISTDGGTYVSTDNSLSVSNLSLTGGLNISQYYTTHTRRAPPYNLLAGSQDQGYQRAFDPPETGALAFEQTLSGDYGHLDSSDFGGNVWMVYPGFVMVDTLTTTPGSGGLVFWDYTSNGLEDWSFLAPVVPRPGAGHQAVLAGGRISGAGGHRLINLTRNAGTISETEDSFVFPNRISALAFSADGNTRYVLDETGRFWRSIGGAAFTNTNPGAGLPGPHYFYGSDILVDPSNPNRILVAGSGYSNPAVFVSTNNGDSFVPIGNGLPPTLVYRLAMSADGQHLFAAAATGAFHFDVQAGQWQDIVALGSPNQIYWDVDYVEPLSVARFSTYGRGIWDFEVDDRIFADDFESL